MKGFTLVEVLVALTLIGLLVSGLTGALRGMSDAADRVDEKAEQVSDMRIIAGFLRRQIKATVALRQEAEEQADSWAGLRGTAETLYWIAPMQARHAPGQFFVFRLSPTSPETLELQYMRLPGDGWDGRWEPDGRHTLLRDLERLDLRYQHPDTGEWQDHWRHHAYLPARVGIKVQSNSSRWPEIIIPFNHL